MRGAPRRAAASLFALALLAVQAAAAQESAPDVPEGPGRVAGRIVHETRPEATAGLEVLLYALAPDGTAGLRATRSDDEGHFVFDGVSNDPAVVYLVGARESGVPYGERFHFDAGELEHAVELHVSDSHSDTAGTQIGPVDVRLELGCTHLRVRQIHVVQNSGKRVYFVPPDQRDTVPPLFEVELPAGAEGFEAVMSGESVSYAEGRVRFWGPLHPGTREIQFGYGVPLDGTDGTLRLGFPSGTSELRVLTPEGVLTASGEALEPAPGVEIEGQRYAVLSASPVAPGDAISLAFHSEPRPEASFRLPSAEIWTELDDAALKVDERLEVAVDGPALPPSPAAPWLCLPLPPEAKSLRFSSDAGGTGISLDPSGTVALHGPFAKGSTPIVMSYRLPADARGATLRRSFPRELSLLHVLVADTGVFGKTDRLHRRRTVRADDRLYQHYEAFSIEPGETVELALERTPPHTSSRWAATVFAGLAALASAIFLMAPLREARAESEPTREESDPFAVELAAVQSSLADLEEDLETGKLSREDHAMLRTELRARAAKLLAEAREARKAASVATGAAAPTCPACGSSARPGDRFCAQCGAALEAARSAS